MSRYERELFAALKATPSLGSQVTLERPTRAAYLSRYIRHKQARRFDSAWNRYVRYPRSIRMRQADVFHILDHGYAQLIRSLDPERTVVTCHDLIPLLAAEGQIPIPVSPTVARTFRMRVAQMARARKVIAISNTTKATLERYTSVPADRINVVYYGVSPAFRSPAEPRANIRLSLGLSEDSRIALQVATSGRYKNTPAVLKALAQLRRTVPEAVVMRLGAPLHSDELELAKRLGVLEHVHHVGMVSSDQQIAKWYAAADLLVFPSLWEGFGWPPLEAMACGTPVVASDIPPIREVVGDAGLLVHPEDPDALAQAMTVVLTDRSVAGSLRQKGLLRARGFTWLKAAEETSAVYKDIWSSGETA